MLVGMEAGMFGGEALLGLQPWREWTWRPGADIESDVAGPGQTQRGGAPMNVP
jgi:hypothetical protein